MAALLTIVGYSLNDTVVIYDRVRENLRRYKTMALAALLDRSINETLARTVMTSLTTLVALIALLVFGGPVIRGFTFAMIWGVLVGTYSTIFVATPLLLHLNLRRESVAPATADVLSRARLSSRGARVGGAPERRTYRALACGGAMDLTPNRRAGPPADPGLPCGRLHDRRRQASRARSWCCPTGRCPGR